MAVIKCKMCGGDLELIPDSTVCECEYCGTKQTVPVADNEKKLSLFTRANKLRAACEFDKAAGVFESIVAEFPDEAEAYWGLVLCKYGIEYVDDPATGKKIPTCHRSSFESILEDSDFEQVLENTDSVARRVYRDEAKAIEEIRKGIIAVSSNEQPYDIFICYKETAENGERTLDSVLAQDIYDALTDKGYRVFFSRITLEDKLGVEYEPYIFAALNSAKIMLAFGTDYEYYNAVWVKNEWSRYLKLMAKDKEKHLIPCYKGIDAYDMPKEFTKLQAQDLGKVGATQDLLRGVEKILPRQKRETQETVTVVQQAASGPNVAALLKRGTNALEDRDWKKAEEFFDEVLNMDAECADAYLGLALAGAQKVTLEEFVQYRLTRTAKAETETFYMTVDDLTENLKDHVEEMVEKYGKGALPESRVRDSYKIEKVPYTSEVADRQQQLEDEKRYWKGFRNMDRAIQYGGAEYAATKACKHVLDAMEQRIRDAKQACEDFLAMRKKYHEQIVKKTDEQVIADYNKVLQEREKINEIVYRRACQMRDYAKTPEEFMSAKREFLKCAGYADSIEQARNCNKTANEMLENKKREAEEEKLVVKRMEKGLCLYCGGDFRGMFSKKCSVCGRPKDY